MNISFRSGSVLRASALVLTALSMTACVRSGTFKREMTATRAEISTERAERLRADSILGADLSGLRTELKKELADLRTEFDAKIVAAGNGMKVMLPVSFAFDDAMIKDADYQLAVVNRTAALVDSRLMRFAPGEAGGGFA